MAMSREELELKILTEVSADIGKMSVDEILAMIQSGEHPASPTLKRLAKEFEARKQ
jgi:hypothetical protein